MVRTTYSKWYVQLSMWYEPHSNWYIQHSNWYVQHSNLYVLLFSEVVNVIECGTSRSSYIPPVAGSTCSCAHGFIQPLYDTCKNSVNSTKTHTWASIHSIGRLRYKFNFYCYFRYKVIGFTCSIYIHWAIWCKYLYHLII